VKQRYIVIAFLLSLASSVTASTVDISFTALPKYQVNGAYVGNVGVTSGTNQTFDLLCGDLSHTTFVPSGPFSYYVSSLPSLSDVRFTGPDVLTTYQTAAVLLYEFETLAVVDDSTAGSYQFAIWKLFTPGAATYGNSTSLLAAAQNTVAQGGIQDAYDHFQVYTPTSAAGSNQEFLGMSLTSSLTSTVPEPSSFLLIGCGLLFIASRFNRRPSI